MEAIFLVRPNDLISPDANVLVLIGEMLHAGKVEGLDGVGLAGEVLGAAVRGEVGRVARILRYLMTKRCLLN